jgi:hypothetical protein
MADVMTIWSPFILTDNGLNLRQRALSGGEIITWSYAKIGEGVPDDPNDIPLLTDLALPSREVLIVRSESEGSNFAWGTQNSSTHQIGIRIDNSDFDAPVLLREMGVFAAIGEESPILYGYTYAEQGYDSIPDKDTYHYVGTPEIDTVISRAASISFNWTGSSLYVTFDDVANLETAIETEHTRAEVAEAALGEQIQILQRKAIPGYGVCSTSASLPAKSVDLGDGFILEVGTLARVMFTAKNTASFPTLNVSGTGGFPIYYRGSAITPGILAANSLLAFTFDGSLWRYTGEANDNPHFEKLTAAELQTGTETTPRVVTAAELNAAIQAIAQEKIDAIGPGDTSDAIEQLLTDVADLRARVSMLEFLFINSSGIVTDFPAGDLTIIGNNGALSDGKVLI